MKTVKTRNIAIIEEDNAHKSARKMNTHRRTAPPMINSLLSLGFCGLIARADQLWDIRKMYDNNEPKISQNP